MKIFTDDQLICFFNQKQYPEGVEKYRKSFKDFRSSEILHITYDEGLRKNNEDLAEGC